MILLLATIIAFFNLLNAQVCTSNNYTLSKVVDASENIVIGKVVDEQCFWNDASTNIYTKYTIEVEQSLHSKHNVMYVTIEGGTIGDVSFEVFGLPKLVSQSEGIFFLKKDQNFLSNKTNANHFHLLDFAAYNAVTNSIENSNSTLTATDFNKILSSKYKTSFRFVQRNEKHSAIKKASISSIKPSVVAAGNNETLTIIGSGFGTYGGNAKISMKSAGTLNTSVFVDIEAKYIKSWTNSRIQFVVPGDEISSSSQGVATGKVRITDKFGSVTTSTQTVEVQYNKKVYNGVPIRLRSKSNNGAISFYVSKKLIDQGALNAVKNALEIWNCATGSNFIYGGVIDNVCKENDGLNVICYDATVPTFNLAITRVVSRNCNTSNVADQVDADITFNPDFNWSFTDNLRSNQFHFESVLVHELGHAFMLGHVVNNDDVMYPSLTNGLIKTELTNNDIEGGLDVMNNSRSAVKCSSLGPVKSSENSECTGCANVGNVKAKNLTKNSVYLNWGMIRNSISYRLRYRINGSFWHQYNGTNNNVILFDLPACTTVECRLFAYCPFENSKTETIYRFATLGCD